VGEAVTAAVVVVFTEEASAVAVSTVAVLVVGSMGEASAVVVSVGDVSAVALSTAVVSVAAVSAVVVSTAVAFVVAVLVGATSAITDSLMMSSSAASDFRGGGAGTIRTDITVTTITPTITMAMDTAGTHMAITMDTADTVTTVAEVTDTAMAADQGVPAASGVGDKPSYQTTATLSARCVVFLTK
jgi:hypothetical protein